MIVTISMNAPEEHIQKALDAINDVGVSYRRMVVGLTNSPNKIMPKRSVCCNAAVREMRDPHGAFVLLVCSRCEKRV